MKVLGPTLGLLRKYLYKGRCRDAEFTLITKLAEDGLERPTMQALGLDRLAISLHFAWQVVLRRMTTMQLVRFTRMEPFRLTTSLHFAWWHFVVHLVQRRGRFFCKSIAKRATVHLMRGSRGGWLEVINYEGTWPNSGISMQFTSQTPWLRRGIDPTNEFCKGRLEVTAMKALSLTM